MHSFVIKPITMYCNGRIFSTTFSNNKNAFFCWEESLQHYWYSVTPKSPDGIGVQQMEALHLFWFFVVRLWKQNEVHLYYAVPMFVNILVTQSSRKCCSAAASWARALWAEQGCCTQIRRAIGSLSLRLREQERARGSQREQESKPERAYIAGWHKLQLCIWEAGNKREAGLTS